MFGNSFWICAGLILGLAIAPNGAFAADAASLTVGTEIKFPASDKGIAFSKCGDDPNYSCAVFEKIATSSDSFKSLSRCSFRVLANIAKLDTAKGRTLTIKQVTHNDDKKVVSAILDGTSTPLSLSCEVEYSQMNVTRTMPGATLTEHLLNGFKEFSLGTVKTEKAKESSNLIPVLKDSPKPRGGTL